MRENYVNEIFLFSKFDKVSHRSLRAAATAYGNVVVVPLKSDFVIWLERVSNSKVCLGKI